MAKNYILEEAAVLPDFDGWEAEEMQLYCNMSWSLRDPELEDDDNVRRMEVRFGAIYLGIGFFMGWTVFLGVSPLDFETIERFGAHI